MRFFQLAFLLILADQGQAFSSIAKTMFEFIFGEMFKYIDGVIADEIQRNRNHLLYLKVV
jgi:hypothetical protein